MNEAVGQIAAEIATVPQRPAFIIHTGDLTHLSKPGQFDDAAEALRATRLDAHFVPGEHDLIDEGNGKLYRERFGKGTRGAGAPPAATQLLVASHVRGLISGQATDVLSSDRHTVKPWFATKSAVSPPVVDLAGDGFPLVGGRLDVIGVTPVPTLVYRHGEHVISLTEVPDAVARLEPGRRSDAGYVVLTWRQGRAAYVAISDAQAAEVEAFAAAYRKATAAPP